MKTIIEIPDPSMTQVKGEGPKFISKRPPELDGLEIRVNWPILVYLDEPQNKHVKKYLAETECRALEEGVSVKRHNDVKNQVFIYRFEK